MRRSLVALLLTLGMLAACGQTQTAAPTPAGEPTTAAAPTTAAEPTTAAATEAPTTAAATAAPTTAAATAAPTTAAASGGKLRVGLVTDVGKVNDGTFNQYAYEGLKRAESELGIETAFIETQAQTDYLKNIDQFASQGYDMIVTVGFLMGDATKEAATKYPDIKFAIVDNAYDPPLPNVEALVFAEDEAGYLAGVLAASLSKSGTVAAVGGVEIPPVQKFLLGYENGAKSVNADIQVKRVYIDSFTDRARGAEAARSFIAEGADVIFGAGGQTGSGGIQAAAQDGVFVIGVDQDEYVTTFQNGSAPGADKILSSAIKRVDVAVFNAIKAGQDGSFKGGTNVFTAANEGVGLAPFHGAESAIPAATQDLIKKTVAGLADGSIKTNVTLP
jgi:basic membrane protein A